MDGGKGIAIEHHMGVVDAPAEVLLHYPGHASQVRYERQECPARSPESRHHRDAV
jgi:hypothetical protein